MYKEVPCQECMGSGFIARFGENSVWSERCEICGGSGIIKEPMTNADRIRAMSDEGLAIVLVKYCGTETRTTRFGGHEHIFYGPNGEKCETKAEAVGRWEIWIKQPAEED